ncbi:MAG: YiiX/YebB-like N1pC/P60 family cysteine hydrolase [Chitinophagaceae bacterium]
MKRIVSLVFLLLAFFPSNARKPKPLTAQLRKGDILFQYIPCGDLCKAIVETTPCQSAHPFNHCGILDKTGNQWMVIEAIGKNVHATPLKKFLLRDTSKQQFVGRLKLSKPTLTAVLKKAESFEGRPYDDNFLPGDSALYCSELVYESFLERGQHLFSLQPMTFKSPKTHETYPAWTEYYKELGTSIPEGLPGINPCAIANDGRVKVIVMGKD